MKALQCKLLVGPAAELSQPKQSKVGPEASCLSLDAAKAPLDGINTTIRPRKSSPERDSVPAPSVNTAGWKGKEASALARRPQRPRTACFPSVEGEGGGAVEGFYINHNGMKSWWGPAASDLQVSFQMNCRFIKKQVWIIKRYNKTFVSYQHLLTTGGSRLPWNKCFTEFLSHLCR